jgi:hypothetical protein
MNDPVVAYIIVPRENATPAEAVAAERAPRSPDLAAVHLCRRLAEDGAPPWSDAPVMDGAVSLSESWLASMDWLQRDLDRGFDTHLAGRIVVPVAWPVSPAAEAALLLARLSAGTIRLAVRVPPAEVAERFHYFDRFGFPWVARPDDRAVAEWPIVMATLCRLWCLDGRARTPLEPIHSAFSRLVAHILGHAAPAWRYVVVDADGTVTPPAPWSPSVHAALVAGGDASLARLDALVQADRIWIDAFRARHAERLRALLSSGAAAGVAS